MYELAIGTKVLILEVSDPFDGQEPEDTIHSDGKPLVGREGVVVDSWEPGPYADYDMFVVFPGDPEGESYPFFNHEVKAI